MHLLRVTPQMLRQFAGVNVFFWGIPQKTRAVSKGVALGRGQGCRSVGRPGREFLASSNALSRQHLYDMSVTDTAGDLATAEGAR